MVIRKQILLLLNLLIFISCEDEKVEASLSDELLNTRWSVDVESLGFKFFEFVDGFYFVQKRTGDDVYVGKYKIDDEEVNLDGFGTLNIESREDSKYKFTIIRNGVKKVTLASRSLIKREILKNKNFINIWQKEKSEKESILIVSEFGAIVFAKKNKEGNFEKGQLKKWFWQDDEENKFCISEHKSSSCNSSDIYDIHDLTSDIMVLGFENSESQEVFVKYKDDNEN